MTAALDTYPTDPCAAALALANLGLRVLPIRPGQKHPPMASWQHAATTDPAIITNWYSGLYSGCGVGVATGQLANGNYLFVLDVDEHDPATSGGETLHELEQQHGPLPDTVEVETGSGGRHLYFLSSKPITNDASRRLGPGLDIRGVGGQVLAPPTIHPNGRPYRWMIGHEPGDINIAWAPLWMIEQLIDTPAPAPTKRPRTTNNIWDVIDREGPAARYNADHTWHDLLSADGWTLTRRDSNNEEHWTRPGKNSREGTSATVGYNGQDVLVVFTSSINWLPPGPYSRFGYYACRHHGGDRSAAARQLRTEHTTPAWTPRDNDTDDWGELQPLGGNLDVPAFPLHTLPNWISTYATQLAEDIQVAVDLPAALALGALSVAALGKSTVHYPRINYTQPLNIYTAVSLPPSAGKSPVKNAMFAPLEVLETRRIERAARDRHRNESQRRILEKREKNLLDRAAKGGEDGRLAELEMYDIANDLAALDKTVSGRLLVDDVTTEALGIALAEAGGNIAMVSAEGGVFDRIAGLYNDGVANMDLYLEAWSGGRYVVDRVKRESITVNKANLVVAITVQPTTLDEVGARKQFAGRGLTARFLLSMPASNIGTRDRLRISTGNEHVKHTYEAHLTDLADEIDEHGAQLVIGDDASLVYAHWDQRCENRLHSGGDLEHLAEWIGKLRANVLRLAGLLHLAHRKPGSVVDTDTIKDAIQIGDYFIGHMLAISARWGIDEATAKARKVANSLVRHNPPEITIREIMRSNRRMFDDAESVVPVLQVLVEHNWLRPLFDGPILLGQRGRGREPQRFALHPQALQMSPNVAHPVASQMSPNVAHVQMSPNVAQNQMSPNVADVQMSRMSRMSPRGENETPPTPSSDTHSQPPTPGDMRDKRDIYPDPTSPDPTAPFDPTGLFE